MLGSTSALSRSLLASLTRLTQSTRLLRLHTPLGADVLLAESLHGEEGIDTGFRLHISALSTDASLPLKSLMGQPVLLELLADAAGTIRPFHGHVSAFELCGANGGLARYRLIIEPWSALLALGRDSRVFQDLSVPDIIDTVFAAYAGRARLAPAWRFDLDRTHYPVRSLCTQYQESDLAFVQRLMSEEGLFSYVEHQGDPFSPALGSHTVVIADSNQGFRASAKPHVRFTQSRATMSADSVDRWRTEHRLHTNAIDLGSWDYRTLSLRQVSAASDGPAELRSTDVPGAYAYPTRQHGERIAERQLQALEAQRVVHTGAGTVRGFAPATTFTLSDHYSHDSGDKQFLIVRVRHLAHNNLDAELKSALTQQLGKDPVEAPSLGELSQSLHATGNRISLRPVYRNSFDAIPANVPYRSSWQDGNGRLLHPRPTVKGQQTAIVVGPPGVPVHTDRDHRIKVQFHWQRGTASHSRLLHPAPDGHTGAPADDSAGTWVRVATAMAPIAGANWGSNALPRVGQEVLIDFLDGNIDRPVVIGTLYNGKGQSDAQANQIAGGAGAATGNAGPWFPGRAGAHAHPAVLSGFKSQAMQSSASGTGAYSQLVFDDAEGEARVSLQRHAQPHQGTAELNLGHLRHQTDNQRLDPAGFGAELKSEHSLAIRAGSGLLLSTDRNSSERAMLESSAPAMQVEQGLGLHKRLTESAQKHNARLPDEPEPGKLPALEALAHSVEVLRSTDYGTDGEHGGDGTATAYSEPHLQLSTPAGIAALTPASAVLVAGACTSIAAEQDINCAAQGGMYQLAKAGISIFTYGKATSASKPNQETGIRLHAASGKVSVQTQSDDTRITADKLLTVASISKSVSVQGKTHVLMTAQGAYLKLEGGNIMLHAPGKVEFKASLKELAGPQSATGVTVKMPSGDLKGCALKLAEASETGGASVER